MRAISVRQPYAWLIIHGGKTIENRGWPTRFRGRLLIHAASKYSFDDDYDARLYVQRDLDDVPRSSRIPDLQSGKILLGGIIGAVTLVDVLPPTNRPSQPWHLPGKFGWVLEDPTPLPFYRVPGQLSFWGSFAIREGEVTRA